MAVNMLGDKRPIQKIYLMDESYYGVGQPGVEEILPYNDFGQLWFAIYANKIITYRVNSAHIVSVVY